MMQPAIRLEKISKRYRIVEPGGLDKTFRETVMSAFSAPIRALRSRREPAPEEYIWALKDLSFEVMPGEAVGVIGRNGAGKSTLLKILARITEPTSGRAELRGRVGSLLDVGTGFHSELTGREYIYLNGAILGMTAGEVRRKFDGIVDFAGVEAFLDTSVKHYSSGMRVRLAFAVAAHLDTEILLADEVIAYGDAIFQKKCVEQMQSLAHNGRTVVFVSHNMGTVGDLCGRSVLIEKGLLAGFGKTHDVIKQYFSEFSAKSHSASVEPPETDRGVAIRRVQIADCSGTPSSELDWKQPFAIRVDFRVTKRLPVLSIGVRLVNQLGVRAVFTWIVFQQFLAPGDYLAQGQFPGEMLTPGRYSIDVVSEDYDLESYHNAQQVVSFEVLKTSAEFGYNLEEYALLYSRVPWQIKSAG